MTDKLFQRLGHRYVLTLMVLTRLCGTIGGMAVIYYVELTLNLPSPLREHFRFYSGLVVVFSCTCTVLMALYETRTLNDVLKKMRSGERIDPKAAHRAGYEAATFVKRHHFFEAWFVPCSTLVPDMICLRLFDNASTNVLMNLTVTVFMGIAMALMSTYYLLEHSMKPVIHYLLNRGVKIDYESMPAGQLRRRFSISFALIILTTALMIGTLARQRASDIITDPHHQEQAVQNLRVHSLGITVVAVTIGVVYSIVLADSVASRANALINSMSRVAGGNLSERVQPTGNDEIDVLARHFNNMVKELEHNDHTIRDLNLNLQDRVKERTLQLEETIRELQSTQSQLTDVAHRAGMAEVATGVLHNVGNVLNSVNISVSMLSDHVYHSSLKDLRQFVSRLEEKGEDLPEMLASPGRAAKLVDFLCHVARRLESEQEEIAHEAQSLAERVEHIKGIINSQQGYARQVSFKEPVNVADLIRDVVRMHLAVLQKHGIEVRQETKHAPQLSIEKSRLLQVIDNLVKNASESIIEANSVTRLITIVAETTCEQKGHIVIRDTGVGICPENLDAVFNYGFTTKSFGSGFGLHASALAMSAIGGRLSVRSDGLGQGATFTVEFPLDSAAKEDDTTIPTDTDEPALCEV
jgi:signal transduction histidine kinase